MRPARLLAALLVTTFGVSSAALADNTPAPISPTLAAMETMVKNMGYTTTDATDNSHFYFDLQGKYDYHVDLAVSPNGELVYLYNYIDTFDAAKMAKAPIVKMMEYQNTGNVFFSMDSSSGKGEDLYANEVFGYPGITPAILRDQFDNLTKSLDETDALWNTDLWK
jgi:hypothetical protein